jgi:parallel beta-helix repeat protein
MNSKKIAVTWLSLAMLFSLNVIIIEIVPRVEAPAILEVDDSGGKPYTSIQAAVDDAQPGDTVFVYAGIYNEDVVIDKTINLTGISRVNTTINTNAIGIFIQNVDFVNISGFTIENGTCGINVSGDNCQIYGNIIRNITGVKGKNIYTSQRTGGKGGSGSGIYIDSSSDNTISGNSILSINGGTGGKGGQYAAGGSGGIGAGVYLYSSTGNNILLNTISSIKGGAGGDGGDWGPGGGCGGVGAGIYLEASTGNDISSNTIFAIDDNSGGGGGTGSSIGATQVGFGIFIDVNSYDNNIETTNTVDGDQVVYYYNRTGITIEDNFLIANSNPTNFGKIVCINCTDAVIKNNTIANYTGMSGETGDYSFFGESGGIGAGVYLSSSTGSNISLNYISSIMGGTGGTGSEDGGTGGIGAGIYLQYCIGNDIFSNTISLINGGVGGMGGYIESGGSGGVGNGVYLFNSMYINITSNTIFSLNGGTGGAGGMYGSGGAGSLGAAVFLHSSTTNNVSNNTLSSILGGTGGAGESIGATQVGFGIYLDPNSLDNFIDNSNTVDGDAVVYFYNRTGITIENYILEANSNPTNFGKITCINCSNVDIKNNAIANYKGLSGETWGDYDIARAGWVGAGIYLYSVTASNISSNDISYIHGGTGGTGGLHSSGGTGGIGAGIYLNSSTWNIISTNILSNINGGTGGRGGRFTVGGTGGFACGIFQFSSTSNKIANNSLSLITGGTGGNGGPSGGTTGNSQVGYGIYIMANSLDNDIEPTNTIDGDAIIYYYNENDLTIEDQILITNSNPTNFGKITCITCSNITIRSNTIANYQGASGENGGYRMSGAKGGLGAGINLRFSTDIHIISNTISSIKGGKGGNSAYEGSGGKGGVSSGIYLYASTDNNITSNIISSINGGTGGSGGWFGSGGSGGVKAGIYLHSSTGNEFISNSISSLVGGNAGSEGFGAPPGNSQEGFGVFIDTNSLDNNIESTNTLDGESIIYYYGKTGITIENYVLETNSNPTNLGKITIINCMNIVIKNNSIANFKGMNGDTGDYSTPGSPGAHGRGIYISQSTGNTVMNNTISLISGGKGGTGGYKGSGGSGGNGGGIDIYSSSSNDLTSNTISSISRGNGGSGGREGPTGSNGIGSGIYFNSANDNLIIDCSISGNQYGIYISPSSGNRIYHNEFDGNTNQAFDEAINIWDDGYPSGGNYWSDYTGEDQYKGERQDIPGSDGIGDTPYIIDLNSLDNYPLMKPHKPLENYTVLKQGWNLISIPLIQEEQNLTRVLGSIDGWYDATQWYNITDTNDHWKHYKVNKPFGNDLYELNETMGFWIHITQPDGTIFIYNGTQPIVNLTIVLSPGWNIVGYPSMSAQNRTNALNNIDFGTDVDAIWTYNATMQKWKEITASDNFEVGRGYWIHSKVTKTWIVPL